MPRSPAARSSYLTGSIFKLADTQGWSTTDDAGDGLVPVVVLVEGEPTAVFFTDVNDVPNQGPVDTQLLEFRVADLVEELPLGIGLVINPDTDCVYISPNERDLLVEAGRPFPTVSPVRLGTTVEPTSDLDASVRARLESNAEAVRVWPALHLLADASLKILLAYECMPGAEAAVTELLSEALDDSSVEESVIIMSIADVPEEAREWLFANVAAIESGRQSVGS